MTNNVSTAATIGIFFAVDSSTLAEMQSLNFRSRYVDGLIAYIKGEKVNDEANVTALNTSSKPVKVCVVLLFSYEIINNKHRFIVRTTRRKP